MSLTAEQILSADDRQTMEVDVPEWGGTVLVRELGGSDRDRFEAFMRKAKETGEYYGFRAMVASMAIVDEDGHTLFTQKHVQALGQKKAAALDRIVDKALSLSGMDDESVAELEKNSAGSPSDSSGTS